MTLKWIFKEQYGGVDWIDLAQDRDRLWAVVKVAMEALLS
jgi:hypothetical protein